MALTVETGSGVTNADAYVSVSDTDTYATNINDVTWSTLSTAAKEAAIRNATLYIDQKFFFAGSQKTSTQGLAWPRSSAYDTAAQLDVANDIVPLAVKRAAMELALKAGAGTTLSTDDQGGGKVTSERVGPIAVTYSESAPSGIVFGITNLLKGLVRDGTGQDTLSVYAPENTSDAYFNFGQFENGGDVNDS